MVTATCDYLKDILRVRDKLHGVAPQPGPQEAGADTARQTRHEAWGDVRVSQVRVWVAKAESEHGTAYGATFGTSHPYDFT